MLLHFGFAETIGTQLPYQSSHRPKVSCRLVVAATHGLGLQESVRMPIEGSIQELCASLPVLSGSFEWSCRCSARVRSSRDESAGLGERRPRHSDRGMVYPWCLEAMTNSNQPEKARKGLTSCDDEDQALNAHAFEHVAANALLV